MKTCGLPFTIRLGPQPTCQTLRDNLPVRAAASHELGARLRRRSTDPRSSRRTSECPAALAVAPQDERAPARVTAGILVGGPTGGAAVVPLKAK